MERPRVEQSQQILHRQPLFRPMGACYRTPRPMRNKLDFKLLCVQNNGILTAQVLMSCLGLLRAPPWILLGKRREEEEKREKKKSNKSSQGNELQIYRLSAEARVTQQKRLPGFPNSDYAFCRERSRKLNHVGR